MEKKTALLIAAIMTAMAANAQLLYRISDNGLDRPSYIVGTLHTASAQFVNKITGIGDAINATEQVYGEVNADSMELESVAERVKTATTIPNGGTLRTVLTDEQYDKVNATLSELLGVGLDNQRVWAEMGRTAPAMLAEQIALLMCMQTHRGMFDPLNTIDSYFQKVAKKNGEFAGGLETVDFQIELLRESDMSRQVELLMCTIDNRQFVTDCLRSAVEAYYRQNIEGVKAAMDARVGNSCDSTPEEEARLLYDRNARWCAMMPAIMAAKPTLFAVGAGHLPGDKGVLALLRAAGYTVDAVK